MEWDEPQGQQLDLESLLRIIPRRRGIMLLVGLLALPIAVVLPLAVPSLYESTATLVVQLPPEVMDFGSDFMPGAAARTSPLGKEMGIVSSDRVLGPVVDRMERPPADSAGLVQRALESIGLRDRSVPLVPALERERRIEGLRGALKVGLQQGSIMEITVRANDAEVSAWLANAIADSLVSYEREERRQASSSAINWLSEKAVELRGRIRSGEQALANLKESMGGEWASVETTTDLTRDRDTRRLELTAVERRLRQLRRGGSDQTEARVRYEAAQAELASARLLYTETHPEVQRLSALVAELRAGLPDDDRNPASTGPQRREELYSLQSKRSQLAAEVAAIEAALEAHATAAKQDADLIAEAVRLERRLEGERDMLALLLRRTTETLVGAADETPVVRILDYASAPSAATGLGGTKLALLGLCLALGLAVGAGLAAELLDPTLHDGETVAAALGVPLLGIIPTTLIGPRGLVDPRSLAGESYRQLRTALLFAAQQSKPRTLLVTSAVAGEGKTTTAVNLAASFARTGMKVLLMDADLRRPKISEVLGIPKTPGLSDLLESNLKPDEAIHRTTLDFDVIPSGKEPQNPADLIGSSKMAAVLSSLVAQYDLVVLDAPVLLSVSDSLVLSSLADGVLFISKPGSVSRKAFTRLADELARAGALALGLVFTQVDTNDRSAYPDYLRSPYTSGSAW